MTFGYKYVKFVVPSYLDYGSIKQLSKLSTLKVNFSSRCSFKTNFERNPGKYVVRGPADAVYTTHNFPLPAKSSPFERKTLSSLTTVHLVPHYTFHNNDCYRIKVEEGFTVYEPVH